jgi:E3 ubiquitin-protein ligase BIG BROTHER-like protein
MMALAGINDREEDDNEDNDSTSPDAWQDVDPDNMLYEKHRRRMDVDPV